jgi:hypothetical protein
MIISTTIPVGLGDLIYVKAMLDPIKNKCSEIKIAYHRELVNVFRNKSTSYNKLLDDFGQLFFSESPYVLTEQGGEFRGVMRLSTDYGIQLQKPELSHLLCKGAPLNIADEYIVLTTKVRYVPRTIFNEKSTEFWNMINQLSNKYKIILLGERVVEMNAEYLHHTAEHIYGIYDDIMCHVPSEKLIDLTIPALGIVNSDIEQIQQDCLIMKNAKFVITLGVGGNFCMATAVANTIGFRADKHDIFEVIFNRDYNGAIITKEWPRFIAILKQYL